MLYLTRKIGETIIINDDIEITVVDVRGKSIKLGLTFPSDVSVYRQEIYERIQAEKAAQAANGGGTDAQPAPVVDDNSSASDDG
jgi:carbon storage regulator